MCRTASPAQQFYEGVVPELCSGTGDVPDRKSGTTTICFFHFSFRIETALFTGPALLLLTCEFHARPSSHRPRLAAPRGPVLSQMGQARLRGDHQLGR